MEVTSDLVGAITDRGYSAVPGSDFRLAGDCEVAFREFRGAWEELGPDRYLPSGATYRSRRHAKFRLSAQAGLVRVRGAGYRQGAGANPLVGTMVREFAPFREHEARNAFFTALVHHNAIIFDRCAGQAPPSWEVDAHLIRVTARPGESGRPSPEGPHRDGFDFIALHHMGRHNVSGGRTTVYASPQGPPLTALTFRAPLDSLYAQDARILHDVSPVTPRKPDAPGHRDMLLMSFKAES